MSDSDSSSYGEYAEDETFEQMMDRMESRDTSDEEGSGASVEEVRAMLSQVVLSIRYRVQQGAEGGSWSLLDQFRKEREAREAAIPAPVPQAVRPEYRIWVRSGSQGLAAARPIYHKPATVVVCRRRETVVPSSP